MPQGNSFRTTLRNRYGPIVCQNFRKLETFYEKLAHCQNSIKFLRRCRNNNIIPKGLRLRPAYSSRRLQNILHRASLSMIRERLQFHRSNLFFIEQDIVSIEDLLFGMISNSDFDRIIFSLHIIYENSYQKQRNIHLNKFNNLLEQNSLHTFDNLNRNNDILTTVVNLSNRHLNATENLVLSKGLNYAVTHPSIPKLDIISSVEKISQCLPTHEKEQYRVLCKLELEKSNQIEQNISKEEMKALKTLRNDDSITILPADKGNATVIMNKIQYEDKITDLITNGPYSKLTKDPTKTLENKIYRALFKFKNDLTYYQRKLMTPHYSKTPHFYGVPKIHKANIPLRPICSTINSPCSELSKFLLNILKPFANNDDTFIKNTKHFLNKLSTIEFNQNNILVSFDINSLFTNVPLDKTLNIIKTKLENDNTLATRTRLNVSAIMELLTLCTHNTYFQLNNEFYKQNFGLAMGSSLSPLLANIFMEDFENNIISKQNLKPTVWWRYVDDVFSIWPHGSELLDTFLNIINDQEETIKFTMEKEYNNSLPFLDVLISKKDIGYETQVYRKPTHTNRYLNYKSNHNINVKKGIIKSLYDRAKITCSNENSFLAEKQLLTSVLLKNDYPLSFINKELSRLDRMEQNNLERDPTTFTRNNTRKISIPYIKGLSEKLKTIGNKFNISTTFKTTNTLRSILSKTKPNNDQERTKNCIYKIPCECEQFYLGETSRPLDVRISEHQSYIKNREFERSQICQHAWDNEHRVQWRDSSIVLKESDSKKRKIKEAALIMLNETNCVANSSVECSRMWLPILKEEVNRKKIPRLFLGIKITFLPSGASSILRRRRYNQEDHIMTIYTATTNQHP
ncbi:uncharacterized protein LOC126887260 [Diabrotica virgifera virgifera]|uniref:Reverse transcriptase domain-containing protein n=1 Tax=Diabrotica virgifera virgifera TaxID=50390 RepID=A0ABM5KKA8_DIAVI|nr:uncharacterized protein LOC126887260 [Diabrotica virgifera virgifera]